MDPTGFAEFAEFEEPADWESSVADEVRRGHLEDLMTELSHGILKLHVESTSVTRVDEREEELVINHYPPTEDIELIVGSGRMTVVPSQVITLASKFQEEFLDAEPYDASYFSGLLLGKGFTSQHVNFFEKDFAVCERVDTDLESERELSSRQRNQHMVAVMLSLIGTIPLKELSNGILVAGNHTLYEKVKKQLFSLRATFGDIPVEFMSWRQDAEVGITEEQLAMHPAAIKIVPYDWVDIRSSKGGTVFDRLQKAPKARHASIEALMDIYSKSILITPVVLARKLVDNNRKSTNMSKEYIDRSAAYLDDGGYSHTAISPLVETALIRWLTEFPYGNTYTAMFNLLVYRPKFKLASKDESLVSWFKRLCQMKLQPCRPTGEVIPPEIWGSCELAPHDISVVKPPGTLAVMISDDKGVRVETKGASYFTKAMVSRRKVVAYGTVTAEKINNSVAIQGSKERFVPWFVHTAGGQVYSPRQGIIFPRTGGEAVAHSTLSINQVRFLKIMGKEKAIDESKWLQVRGKRQLDRQPRGRKLAKVTVSAMHDPAKVQYAVGEVKGPLRGLIKRLGEWEDNPEAKSRHIVPDSSVEDSIDWMATDEEQLGPVSPSVATVSSSERSLTSPIAEEKAEMEDEREDGEIEEYGSYSSAETPSRVGFKTLKRIGEKIHRDGIAPSAGVIASPAAKRDYFKKKARMVVFGDGTEKVISKTGNPPPPPEDKPD